MTDTPPVRRRQLFYLAGFDPRGAAYYHRLYCEQAVRQSRVSGVAYTVTPRQRTSATRQTWRISADATAPPETPTTCTDYHFLVWDDLVRAHWSGTLRAIYGELLFTLRTYYASGLILTFARASLMQMIAGLFPLAFLGLGGGVLLAALLALAGVLATALPSELAWPAAAALIVAGLWGLRTLLLRLGNWLGVFWLQRIYVFSVRWARGEIAGLDARLDAFAADIRAALDDPATDEVLIVAHSVGTMLAVPVVDRVLPHPQAAGRLSLLTLGECIPLASFQPEAAAYRASLQRLAARPELTWLDYTAPTDGACFPLFDPVTGNGLVRTPGAGPVIRSPRFFKAFTAATYRRLRRDWYTTHFLYLMATEIPDTYDYFALTAGPRPLRAHLNA